MKKILLLFGTMTLLATTAQADVEINETNFPDETFRSMITSLPEGQDGVLTDEEICKITYLSLKGDVTNAKGIEYLTSLTKGNIDRICCNCH